MVKLFSASVLLLMWHTLSAQFSWSPVLPQVTFFEAPVWETQYDIDGHYYLKEKDDPYNPLSNRSLIYSEDGLHWSMTDYHPGRRHFAGLNGIVYAYESGQLLRSDNHGADYQTISDSIPFPINFLVRENGQIIITNSEGIFTSDDQGATWQMISSLSYANPVIMAGDQSLGCWKYIDNVFNYWRASGPGEPLINVFSASSPITSVQFTKSAIGSNGRIYITTGGDYNRFVWSEDGGETWSESAVKPGAPAQIQSIAILPDGRPVARLNDNKWYISEDQGHIWTETANTVPDLATLAFSFADNSFFVYGTPMLQRYLGPGQFTYAAFGLDNSGKISLHSPDAVYMAVRGGILKVEDNNMSFIRVAVLPEKAHCTYFLWDNDGRLYKQECYQDLLVSEDFGAHFDTILSSADMIDQESVRQVLRTGDTVRILTSHYLYTSKDGGNTWTHNAAVAGLSFFEEVAVTASGTIFVNDLDKLWRSDDDGQTFTAVNFFPWVSNDIQCVGNTLYNLKGYNNIFSTTDGGENWSALPVNPLDGIFDENESYFSSFIVTDDQQIYAAGKLENKATIFQSKDGGQSWASFEIESDLPGSSCNIVGWGKDGRLYFTSQGSVVAPQALYKTDEPVVLSGKEPDNSIKKLSVFPNPANEKLHVAGLNKGVSQIGLYNQAGVLLQQFPCYETVFTLDVAALPAGIYILKATGEDGVRWSKWIKTGQ